MHDLESVAQPFIFQNGGKIRDLRFVGLSNERQIEFRVFENDGEVIAQGMLASFLHR